MKKFIVILMFLFPAFANAACNPDAMGFFDYMKCGKSGVEEYILPYEEELRYQKEREKAFYQENLMLVTQQENYKQRLAYLKSINIQLNADVAQLKNAVDRYNNIVANETTSFEARKEMTYLLVAQLNNYSEHLDGMADTADMSYDEFKKMREIVGLASDLHSYNKLRIKVQEARGASQKIKVAARGLVKRAATGFAMKALTRFIPVVGWLSLGVELLSFFK